MKILILISTLFITSVSFAQSVKHSKVDIMSKGVKQGFKIHPDCSLSEKYILNSCTHIPEQIVFCHNYGEKKINEQTDCSGSKIKISLEEKPIDENIRKKQGQGNFQKRVKFLDLFRPQQQQQQQESGR
jgi:hypothetical protein